MLFVDQEKAHNRVDINTLWKGLQNYGIKGQLYDNIRALCNIWHSAVTTRGGLIDAFVTTAGYTRAVLLPLLFNINMDRITKGAARK